MQKKNIYIIILRAFTLSVTFLVFTACFGGADETESERQSKRRTGIPHKGTNGEPHRKGTNGEPHKGTNGEPRGKSHSLKNGEGIDHNKNNLSEGQSGPMVSGGMPVSKGKDGLSSGVLASDYFDKTTDEGPELSGLKKSLLNKTTDEGESSTATETATKWYDLDSGKGLLQSFKGKDNKLIPEESFKKQLREIDLFGKNKNSGEDFLTSLIHEVTSYSGNYGSKKEAAAFVIEFMKGLKKNAPQKWKELSEGEESAAKNAYNKMKARKETSEIADTLKAIAGF